MAKIDHVVVLMLENRSFDHIFGWYKDEWHVDGLTEGMRNVVETAAAKLIYKVETCDSLRSSVAFDPPHEYEDVTEQIFGTPSPVSDAKPDMSGFARRAKRASLEHASTVMQAWKPGALPAIHALAKEFAVCDHWFSSVPGPTWPNRFFAHCASAGGYLDGKVRIYGMPTVFSTLARAGKSWRVYYHDFAHAMALADEMKRLPFGRFSKFGDFAKDAAAGQLPNYTFIEPNYFNVRGGSPNDQHPPAGMQAGDDLVRSVYETLRASKHWKNSLLLIVWDEHGGFYDHVPPPAVPAQAIDRSAPPGQFGFKFDRLGVRVPAIIVSPYVPAGTVIKDVFEHASIPATLRDIFGTGAPLTLRDQEARPVTSALTLSTPRDALEKLPRRTAAPLLEELTVADAAPTSFQLSLLELAEQVTLPTGAIAASRGLTYQERVERNQTRTDDFLRRDAKAHQQDTAHDHEGMSPQARGDATASDLHLKHEVRPDRLDLRDRVYQAPVSEAPRAIYVTTRAWQAFNQEDTAACTGYALAALIDFLQERAKRSAKPVSPRMLYSMGRRYDEFDGAADAGSSLRGALKGWFRHGACSLELWPNTIGINDMPTDARDPRSDWWSDALNCPLGAYYRIETQLLADLHGAIRETGAVYASARFHSGWNDAIELTGAEALTGESIHTPMADIPFPSEPLSGGHAFVIVGYDQIGFHVLSSWGPGWGTGGIARLSYADWLSNAMDAWVVQLGVPTAERRRIASQRSLSLVPSGAGNTVAVAGEPVVRDHQLGAFIIDAGNEGRLSQTGRFRTRIEDVRFLLQHHLGEFRRQHQLGASERVKIAIYAHGGLVDEDNAARTAALWIPKLYEAGIFPIFMMWETGLVNIVRDLIEDAARRNRTESERAGASFDVLDRLLERAVRPAGSAVWAKMKSNAAALTRDPFGALRLLFDVGFSLGVLAPDRVDLHLIGHSAGSIVHAELANWLVRHHYTIASLTHMAPAIRVDLFEDLVLPRIGKEVKRYIQFSLSEDSERADPTVPIYTKSLLYLVARSFEGRDETPILGMKKHLDERFKDHKSMTFYESPGAMGKSRTHGGFDDDIETLKTVIAEIRKA